MIQNATHNTNQPIEREQRAIIYTRLSRDSETGLSIAAQEREAREYAQRQGILEVEVVTEQESISAKVPFRNRKGGEKAVQLITSGRFAHVITRERSRATRDLQDSIWFRDLLANHNVTLHTSDGPVSLESPANRLAENVTASVDQYEREVCGDRIRRAKRQKALQGQHTGGPPPFGYTSQSAFAKTLRDGGMEPNEALQRAQTRYPLKGHLVIDQAEARIVLEIFDLYVNRRIGCRQIAIILNNSGRRRRSGLPWCPDKVRRVINDPTVAGFIPFDEEKFARGGAGQATPKHLQHLYPGQHEAIITPELWHQAQDIKLSNTCKQTGLGNAGPTNRRYALSGLVRCRCGGKMKAVGDAQHHYLVCYHRRDYGTEDIGGCSEPRIEMAKAETAFWEVLQDMLCSSELVDKIQQAAVRLVQAREESDRDGPSLQQQMAKIVIDIDKWYERHDAATVEVEQDVAYQRIIALTQRKQELENQIKQESTKPPLEPVTLSREEIEKYLQGLGKAALGSKDRGCGLVRLLVEYHGLEVSLLDSRQLRVVLRFRPPGANDDEASEAHVPVDLVATLAKGEVDRWLELNRGRHVCTICGGLIRVTRQHYWRGIPRHHHRCWASQLTAKRSNPAPNQFYNATEIALLFGVGRTTVGRWIKSQKITPVEKKSGVLLFDKETIEALLADYVKSK